MSYSKYMEEEREFQEILTFSQFMDYLDIGRTKAYELLQSGELKVFKIGKNYKIPKKSVEEYVDRKRQS